MTGLWDVCYVSQVLQFYPDVVSRQYGGRPAPVDILSDPIQKSLLCKNKGSSSGLENTIQALGPEICPALQMRGQLECMELCLGMSRDPVKSLWVKILCNLL